MTNNNVSKIEPVVKKITYDELCEIFRKHNEVVDESDYKQAIKGVVVFKQSNFDTEYSELSRSYKVSSCNRAFQHGKIANSIFADCLDGTDKGVRLDWYKWEVEYCYLLP